MLVRNFYVKRYLLAVLLSVFCTFAGAEESLWTMTPTDVAARTSHKGALHTPYRQAIYARLNEDKMRQILSGRYSSHQPANRRRDKDQAKGVLISLPLAGSQKLMSVTLMPSPLLPKELAEKYPAIRTYRVSGDEQVIGGRVDITPLGFHAMIQTRAGETYFIDPLQMAPSQRKSSGLKQYVSYRKSDQFQSPDQRFSCGVNASDKPAFTALNPPLYQRSLDNKTTGGHQQSLLTYKIAIATTGEYAKKFGGTVGNTLSAIVTTLNRVNQVYEQDLGVHLELVANNDQIIFTDEATDPYDSFNQRDLVAQNQRTIDQIIGVENYDIGHLFTASGGGLAAVGSVCDNNRKAQGVSGISHPQNDSFNLDFVAHEIGHQLGATHTFNSVQGACGGNNRDAATAFEPGSGSSIMSYAGYCGVDNLQLHSDAMFHVGSIRQIASNVSYGQGKQCGERKPIQNNPPQVDAGRDRIIPANTPFELIGTATDSDGDPLVYAWEQVDAGRASFSQTDTGDNALFRLHIPVNSPIRQFPEQSDLLFYTKTKGESLPIRHRSLQFNLVVQGGVNSAQSDAMQVTILRTGSRFALNMPRAHYAVGETVPVYWNTANTFLPPINCENIDIRLSTDGGIQFNKTLAMNVPNTGRAMVTLPADTPSTSQGRFKIKCSDNIFFAVSYRNFLLTRQGDQVVGGGYVDEDQPEPNLADRTLESLPELANTTGSGSSGSKGGGSMGGLLLLLGLMLSFKKKRWSHG